MISESFSKFVKRAHASGNGAPQAKFVFNFLMYFVNALYSVCDATVIACGIVMPELTDCVKSLRKLG